MPRQRARIVLSGPARRPRTNIAPSQITARNRKSRTAAQQISAIASRDALSEIQNALKSVNTDFTKRSTSDKWTPEQQQVIASFALPFESEPQRVSTIYSSGKTAIAGPWKRRPLGMYTAMDANPNPGAQLSAQFGLFVQFRDILRHTVMYDSTYSTAGAGATTYGVRFPNDSSGGSPTVTLQSSVGENFITALWAAWTNGYAAHGPILYPGSTIVKPDGRFFWIDSGSSASTVNCTFDVGAPGRNLRLNLVQWEPDGLEAVQQFVVLDAAGAQVIPVTESGYYAVSYSASVDITNFAVSLVYNGTDFYAHAAVKDLEDNILVLDGVIVPSFAHIITNKSALVNRQGEIVQLQVPLGDYWYDLVDYDILTSSAGNATRIADNGSYSFCKPTSNTDYGVFSSNVDSEAGVMNKSCFQLENTSDYLMTMLNILAAGGRSFFVSESAHLNFRTKDVWRNLETASVDSTLYDRAVASLKDMPQFYENPLHFREIVKGIKTFVRKAVPVVEKTVALGSKYGPAAMRILKQV